MLSYELLAEPTKWCQQALARNELGERCTPDSLRAQQWDVLGAIYKCYNQRQDQHEIYFRLAFHLRRTEQLPDGMTIGGLNSCREAIKRWNDHHTTTHIEILEALTLLGI